WIASSGDLFSSVRKDGSPRTRIPAYVAARAYSATQFMTTPLLQATLDIHEHAVLFLEKALQDERAGRLTQADAMVTQGIALLDVLRSSVMPEQGPMAV